MSALLLPALIGFTGLAVDVGSWYAEKARLQTTADAAALGGAWELRRSGSTDADIEASAAEIAARNGFTQGTDDILVVTTDQAAGIVTAEVRRRAPLFFSGLFLTEAPMVAARAVALVNPPPACILALEPSAEAVKLNGNGNVTAEGCAIHLNSTAPKALSASGNGAISAAAICVGGGYSGRAGAYSPEPLTNCPPRADPFANLPVPDTAGCDHLPTRRLLGRDHLRPGVYCGGIKVSGTADVVFEPGLYVIKNGGLDVSGIGEVSGEGVTFVLTGNGADIKMSGNTEVALSAPTSGDMAGILFYQNPAEQPDKRDVYVHQLSGGHHSRYDGVLYLPNAAVTFTGHSAADLASASMIVARRYTFSGNGSLRIAPKDDVAAANAIPVTLME